MANDYGQSMWDAREGRGLSRKQLSEQSGIAWNSIRAYETGEVSPSLNALVALADALRISIDEYVGHRRRSMFEGVKTDGQD